MLPHQNRWMANLAASGSRLLIPSSCATCILQMFGQRSRRKQGLGLMLYHSSSSWGKVLVCGQSGSSGLHQTANISPPVGKRIKVSHVTLARKFSTSSFALLRFMKRTPRQHRKVSKEAATGEESVSETERLEEFMSLHSNKETMSKELVNEVAGDPGFEGTCVIYGRQSQRNPINHWTNQRPGERGKVSSKRSDDGFPLKEQGRCKDRTILRSRVSGPGRMQGEGMTSSASLRHIIHSTEVETVSADLLEMDSRKRSGVQRKSKAEGWRKQSQQENGKSFNFHKRAKEHLTTPHGHDLLYGISPCLLALQHGRREVHQLYVTTAFQNSGRSEVKEILDLVEEKGLRMWRTNRRVLDKFSEQRPHQGVCLETSHLYFSPVQEEGDEGDKGDVPASSLRLVLDQIKDPMNLGALLRSAYFLGIDRVVVSKKNCCSLTPVVSKASSGVMEIMPVYATADVSLFLEDEKKKGWSVVGASIGSCRSSKDITPCHKYNQTGPVLLVVGNEGFGLSSDISEQCSEFISVPAGRQLHAGIDSLNVSVATGILLHSLLGRK